MKILGFEPRVTPLLHSKCSDLLLWDQQKLIYLFFLEFPGIFVLIQFWPIIVPTIIRRKIGGARWGKFRNDKNVIFTASIKSYILRHFHHQPGGWVGKGFRPYYFAERWWVQILPKSSLFFLSNCIVLLLLMIFIHFKWFWVD